VCSADGHDVDAVDGFESRFIPAVNSSERCDVGSSNRTSSFVSRTEKTMATGAISPAAQPKALVGQERDPEAILWEQSPVDTQ
jgi:hypothetical protein